MRSHDHLVVNARVITTVACLPVSGLRVFFIINIYIVSRPTYVYNSARFTEHALRSGHIQTIIHIALYIRVSAIIILKNIYKRLHLFRSGRPYAYAVIDLILPAYRRHHIGRDVFMGMYLTEISLAPIYSFWPLGSSSEQITALLRLYGFRRRGVGD